MQLAAGDRLGVSWPLITSWLMKLFVGPKYSTNRHTSPASHTHHHIWKELLSLCPVSQPHTGMNHTQSQTNTHASAVRWKACEYDFSKSPNFEVLRETFLFLWLILLTHGELNNPSIKVQTWTLPTFENWWFWHWGWQFVCVCEGARVYKCTFVAICSLLVSPLSRQKCLRCAPVCLCVQ